jgi:hypothetical protein
MGDCASDALAKQWFAEHDSFELNKGGAQTANACEV